MRSKEAERKLMKAAALVLVAVARASAQDPRVVVSIPDRKLALLDNGRVVKVYDLAVGKPSSPSPTGTVRVVTRIPHPTWYQPGKVVGPGKANPLGTRWIGLSLPGYGIHGTNAPRSIGRAASHGCFRMRNRDVEELFELVATGDVIELIGERDERTARLFESAAAAADGGE